MSITLLMAFTLGYFTYPMLGMSQNYFEGRNEKKKQKEIDAKKQKLLRYQKLGKLVRGQKGYEVETEIVDSAHPKNKKYHLEPKYHGYEGGYDLITKCQKCTMTALYEDQHPAKPCHFCGGNVKPDGAGKWMSNYHGEYQWIKTMESE